MDKIVDLKKFKDRKKYINSIFSNDLIHSTDPELEKIKMKFIDVTVKILSDWKENAINDSLNDLIISYFKNYLIDKTLQYTIDLNAIAKLEKHVRFSPMIIGPASSPSNPIGWCAGFYYKGLLITTPEFSSEVYARCFNLLLFISLSKKGSNF